MQLKGSSNLLFRLQFKKFNWIWQTPRIITKFTFLPSFLDTVDGDFLGYPRVLLKLLRWILLDGNFFGVGLHGYYSLDLSKKQRLARRDDYQAKLQIKKDSWFFYGFIIARRFNFLSSTIVLWNVFYNEIMEKTFPIFSLWNSLTGPIATSNVWHLLAPVLKKNTLKKRFFFVRSFPRAIAKITLAS